MIITPIRQGSTSEKAPGNVGDVGESVILGLRVWWFDRGEAESVPMAGGEDWGVEGAGGIAGSGLFCCATVSPLIMFVVVHQWLFWWPFPRSRRDHFQWNTVIKTSMTNNVR